MDEQLTRMATCPNCHTRDGVTVEEAGQLTYRLLPIGGYSLAGVQPKLAARSYPIVVLTCAACGWSVRCFRGPDAYHQMPGEEET